MDRGKRNSDPHQKQSSLRLHKRPFILVFDTKGGSPAAPTGLFFSETKLLNTWYIRQKSLENLYDLGEHRWLWLKDYNQLLQF
jgi:hypothetical protein